MHLIGVLDDDHVLTLPALKAELGNRRTGIVEKPALVIGIGPSLGHDGRTVVRTHLGFVGLDQHIERLGIDVALRHKDGFEGSYAQFHLAEMRGVGMIMFIMQPSHPSTTSAARSRVKHRLAPQRPNDRASATPQSWRSR